MNCPLCSSDSKPAFEAKGFPLEDCIACGHRFAAIIAGEAHLAENYSNDYFTGGGAGYADYLAEGAILRSRGRMYARKVATFIGPGRLLDVGSAAGFILKGFSDEGWAGVGVEPNAAMAATGRESLSLDIRVGSIETLIATERFDLVSMIQVAAHFYDPVMAFTKARDLLNEGGCLLIESWDRSSRMARVFGKSWHEYSPPSVLHWYTQSQLTTYLEGLGFSKIAGGRPSKKISGGHVRSLLKYRLGETRLLKLIPKQVNFPYPSEDLFWALYRKCGAK
ncbi:MAG: class I SAM-dependent methyltransferase [Acidobacteriota bacterium]